MFFCRGQEMGMRATEQHGIYEGDLAIVAARSFAPNQREAWPAGTVGAMTAKVRVASTVQTAKGVEYIAASAPDTYHEAIVDLGKNHETGRLRKARRA